MRPERMSSHCIGIVASASRYGSDFRLVPSHALLTHFQAVITGGIRLPQRDVNDFILALMAFARSSDGAILDDPPLPGANPPRRPGV